jgi:hypothetical protein
MSKLVKVILTTLMVGLVCLAGIYYFEATAVKCTIALAYGMFLLIYGMIVAPIFNKSLNEVHDKGDEFYELETEVVEEETEINNTEENETK